MPITRLLIANRGEVAVRVIRSAMDLGIGTVAVYSEDDRASLHVSLADEARPLGASGAGAYLDIARVVAAAKAAECDAVHPGWGFLAENAEFARRCEAQGLIFVGPSPETLVALGDKTRARHLASANGVPTLRGSGGPVTAEEARQFLESLGRDRSMVIKAVAGGGGRGMRIVDSVEDVEALFRRCQSEALRAFGNGDVYVEERMPRPRHIEVQIVGDGTGEVAHLWERDCSLQRRHQKVVEIAPSPVLDDGLRALVTADAVRMASTLSYRGLGTFEFLVDPAEGRYAFIEANPRLQVEHTVTEEILGLDLVRVQLQLAAGARLSDLALANLEPHGIAMQLRVNAESMQPDGSVRPSVGVLERFEPPSGLGVRIDTFAYPGYETSPAFDSLLAKLIVHAPSGRLEDVVARAQRSLREFRVAGVQTNLAFLKNLVEHPEFRASRVHTTFVDEHAEDLARSREEHAEMAGPVAISGHTAGAKVDAVDPLAVLTYGKSRQTETTTAIPKDTRPGAVLAPMQSTVVSFEVAPGDRVRKGQDVAVVNAMKMEHVLKAPVSGTVLRLNAMPGDTVVGNQLLLVIEESDSGEGAEGVATDIDPDYIRPDLAQIVDRHGSALDAARPGSVAKRHASGHRTARENIADLCDPGSFIEYGSLVLANDPRMTTEQLLDKGAADGIIVGIGAINGEQFDEPASQCMVMSYDYMVMAGTQGARNHHKTDRGISVAAEAGMPVVLFAEGGGGRAGGGGGSSATGPGSTITFAHFARLSGLVPLVGVTTGRCFAGNASLLGCCDVIIATEDSNIGMGGPAMVEGGGLGVYAPEDIGPMEVQVPNGVVDIAVADEAEAVAVARKYLSYFQGPLKTWEAPDQRRMRHIVPENRLRAYDVHDVIETLADVGTVLEIRPSFGEGMVTSLLRIEGRPIGVVANDPRFFGGAITSEGSDKAARFMQLCDAFDIPLLFLIDTPGMMVGPEIEKTALVRHCSRLFIIGANVAVPNMAIILRKSYGLGAIAMASGSFKSTLMTVSWPTGEFGGMGLEGQVKLGFRKELTAIDDPEERRRWFEEKVADAYERGKALHEAVIFGVDDTIDPADSRRWVSAMLSSVRTEPRGKGKKRPWVDAW